MEQAIAERVAPPRRRRRRRSGAPDELRRVRHHRLGAHRSWSSVRTGSGSCSARSARSSRSRRRGRVTAVASPPAPPLRAAPTASGAARYIVAIGGCVVAVVAIIVLAVVLSENVVYFRTVTEAVHNRTDEGTSRFRLAGAVVDGSVARDSTRRRELRGDRRQEHGDRPPRRRPARPLQGRRAGRVRGALGVESARNAPFALRSHPDQARRRLRSRPKVDTKRPRRRDEQRESCARIRVGRVRGGAAVVGITALLAGLALHDALLLRFGRRCVFVVLGAALAAAGVMEWALISHDFSIRYVAENNATRHAVALHDHRALGRARGLDPPLGA